MKQLTRQEFEDLLRENDLLDSLPTVERWLSRGDGAAVYRSEAFDRSDFGSVQVASFGSGDAQLEVAEYDEVPRTLPDIGGQINWPYQLFAVHRCRASACAVTINGGDDVCGDPAVGERASFPMCSRHFDLFTPEV